MAQQLQLYFYLLAMSLNSKTKELSKQIQNYYLLSHQSHRTHGLSQIFNNADQRSEKRPSGQPSIIQQMKYLEAIHQNIKNQQARLKHNNQILLMRIADYYIQISKKLDAQRNQIEHQLKQQFDQTFSLLQSYQNQVKSLKLIPNHDQTFSNTFNTFITQIKAIQIPTIIYQQASLHSLDSIILSMHPLIQFSTYKQQQNFKKKTAEQHSCTKEQSKCRSDLELSSAFNKGNKQQGMVKTVLPGKQCDYFLCEEQFEWGYKTGKTNKKTALNEIITEQSESKQNSLLSQEKC